MYSSQWIQIFGHFRFLAPGRSIIERDKRPKVRGHYILHALYCLLWHGTHGLTDTTTIQKMAPHVVPRVAAHTLSKESLCP